MIKNGMHPRLSVWNCIHAAQQLEIDSLLLLCPKRSPRTRAVYRVPGSVYFRFS